MCGAGFDAGDEAIRPERDGLYVARFRQRREDDVGLPCEGARAVCPDGAIGKMMAGHLSVQVVDEELETGSLHVGGHPAAHGAQPDEPYRHVILGHPITVAAISDFRSVRYRLAVCLRLRKAGAAKPGARFKSRLAPALPNRIDLHDKYRPSLQNKERA